MATANVTFMTAGGPTGAMPAFNAEPLRASEDVASGAASSAAPANCFVRIHTDGSMRVAFGASPTAASTDMRLDGEFNGWIPGGWKVAVLDD